jgi:transposase
METISMNTSERKRLEVMSRVKLGKMSLVAASQFLQVSYRHTKRIYHRYLLEGDRGLVHQARGRPSNHQASAELKEKALQLYEEHFADFGPTLGAEYLAKEFNLVVKVSSFRRWLMTAGLWKRERRRKERRQRRPRRRHAGELVQMDGSFHDWFEGRRDVCSQDQVKDSPTLMVLVDDATGRTFAQFYENESWHSAADVFRQYTELHGLPRSLYVDRHGIYRAEREPTPEEILADKKPETQFGRAMRELDVELILAGSAQAKGRVECKIGNLQKRLILAMRWANINDLESANTFLKNTFLPDHNGQFYKVPAESSNWHREVTAEADLVRSLSVQEERVVNNDWTIRWKNQVLQLVGDTADLVDPKDSITVCKYIDDTLHLFAGERELAWSPSRDVASPKDSKKPRSGPTGSSQGNKPSASHPWSYPGGKEQAKTENVK